LELAGYYNILSKMVGSNNKLNNALATIKALSAYKHADYFSSLKVAKLDDAEPVLDEKTQVEEKKTSVKKAVVKKTSDSVEEKKAPVKKAPVKKTSSTKKVTKEED
jgi:hypothetical protein